MKEKHSLEADTPRWTETPYVSPKTKSASDRVAFLVVDDDEVVHMAVKRAFTKRAIENSLYTVSDGVEALEFLRGPDGSGCGFPVVVLLDLNMPRMNGHEFLSIIRKDDALYHLPVFVMSTSEGANDIESAYRQNIAGYIVKQNGFETTLQIADLLKSYTNVVSLKQ